VVRKSAGHPGGGFVAWDIDDIETGLERVYEYPWASLLNPFAYAADETVTLDVLAEELLQNPGIAGDVYARVRVRGVAQQTFRRALLEAYEHACAFCGMTFCDSLEAAHIVPWTSCTQSERLDPQNGLLLCGTHHALFDARFLTINANYQLRHTDDTYELDQYTTADLWFTRRLDGCQIRLPQREHLRPALKYIEKRNSA
jgi:putative restriction endonuclease